MFAPILQGSLPGVGARLACSA
ncbi:hypothetical protein PLANTIT3_60637 [Plantibacter sp. T3]|nr:hypothetical protein PLANTIT3_60637 [Plantibacter sp. T3]